MRFSTLKIFAALLVFDATTSCTPDGSGTRSTTGTSNESKMTGGKSSNTVFGDSVGELVGIFTGLSDDEKYNEIVLFEKSLSKGNCVTPSVETVDDSVKEINLIMISIPVDSSRVEFSNSAEADRKKVKITFARSSTDGERQDSSVSMAERGRIDLTGANTNAPQLKIQASEEDSSSVQQHIKLLNCVPHRLNLVFPGLPEVPNTFKRYVEVILVGTKKTGNTAADKIKVHLDAQLRPEFVSIVPGDYNVTAQLISERKADLEVLKKTSAAKPVSLKAGDESELSLQLNDVVK